MNIPIEHLKKIKTISGLKTLISFFEKSAQLNSDTFEYTIREIAKDANISTKSVVVALGELIKIGIVKEIAEDRTQNIPKKYQLDVVNITTIDVVEVTTSSSKDYNNLIEKKEDVVEVTTIENPVVPRWQLATGARKKKVEETDNNIYINNIYNNIFNNIKDYNELDINLLYNKDINSTSIVNANMYLKNEKELGSLANRIFTWVLPMLSANPKQTPQWYSSQKKTLKDLLFKWRTEQVLACIWYWTTIKPPKNGITSVRFFAYKGNIEKALDYFKTEYLANAHEYDQEILEDKVLKAKEALAEQEREKEEAIQQAESMKNITQEEANVVANDILSELLSGIKIDFKR